MSLDEPIREYLGPEPMRSSVDACQSTSVASAYGELSRKVCVRVPKRQLAGTTLSMEQIITPFSCVLAEKYFTAQLSLRHCAMSPGREVLGVL